MIYWKQSEVIDLLDKLKILKYNVGFRKIEPIEVTRDLGDYCWVCGRLYDQCVCRHNKIVQAFMDLRSWDKWEIK